MDSIKLFHKAIWRARETFYLSIQNLCNDAKFKFARLNLGFGQFQFQIHDVRWSGWVSKGKSHLLCIRWALLRSLRVLVLLNQKGWGQEIEIRAPLNQGPPQSLRHSKRWSISRLASLNLNLSSHSNKLGFWTTYLLPSNPQDLG